MDVKKITFYVVFLLPQKCPKTELKNIVSITFSTINNMRKNKLSIFGVFQRHMAFFMPIYTQNVQKHLAYKHFFGTFLLGLIKSFM